MAEQDDERRLAAAVRAGNPEAVRTLLEAGADPEEAVDGNGGLPVLCTAVDAFAYEVAEALVAGGADPDRELPDGTTPLLRAVEGGSPATVRAVRGEVPRLSAGQRERLLAAARHWYETGAEEELRRRTGATGPAQWSSVEEEWCDVEQVSLGGVTVRAGHGAVLTELERAFRIPTPVEELVARAVRHPDVCHVDYSASCLWLVQRRDRQTWSAVVAFRHHPSPDHRRFVVDYLRSRDRDLSISLGVNPYQEEEAGLFKAWAVEETDGGVLAAVLDAVSDDGYDDPLALRYAGHPDPRLRREVPHLFEAPLTPEATAALFALSGDPDPEVRGHAGGRLGRELGAAPEVRAVVLGLVRDPDPGVRATAAAVLAVGDDRTPEATEALVALLAEEDQELRLEGAYGLALRDDPRTREAYERVGPLGPQHEHDHRRGGLWRNP
ncbi:HEAT repeat domain-containing protein [Streptomyces katrae]|uniref:HEAT repeat domain-containing protein n=1 Tax=Streptomyces katrae TaxID=68223 RepID=UPI0004C220FD|nr:HEAT repeat domain-containing protein [Streptomyces katrae]